MPKKKAEKTVAPTALDEELLATKEGRRKLFTELRRLIARDREWTYKRMAEVMNVSLSAVSMAVGDARTPSADAIRRLWQAIGGFDKIDWGGLASVEAQRLSPEFLGRLQRICQEAVQFPWGTQIKAADELVNLWGVVRRLLSGAAIVQQRRSAAHTQAADHLTRLALGNDRDLEVFPEGRIPDQREFFEALKFGYYKDYDRPGGEIKWLRETITLRLCSEESDKHGILVFDGNGGHNLDNPDDPIPLISRLRAERVSDRSFTLRASIPEKRWGFSASFTECIEDALVGIWFGESNDPSKRSLYPMVLSARKLEESEVEVRREAYPWKEIVSGLDVSRN